MQTFKEFRKNQLFVFIENDTDALLEASIFKDVAHDHDAMHQMAQSPRFSWTGAGEDSHHEVTQIPGHSYLYSHLSKKISHNTHVVVTYGGKSIASIHPNHTSTKRPTVMVRGDAVKSNHRGFDYNKGQAIDNIKNKIHEAGGDYSKVHFHTFHASPSRSNKVNTRYENKTYNEYKDKNPKSLTNIMKKAADKIIDKKEGKMDYRDSEFDKAKRGAHIMGALQQTGYQNAVKRSTGTSMYKDGIEPRNKLFTKN